MRTDETAGPGQGQPPPRTGRRFVVAFLAVVVALAVLGVAGAVVIADGAEDDGHTDTDTDVDADTDVEVEVEVPARALPGHGEPTLGCPDASTRPVRVTPDAPTPAATPAVCGPVVLGATPTNARR